MITGHCECGAVRYSARGPITDFSHCHCSMCRRLHGAPDLPAGYHQYVDSRAPWLEIYDDLPQFSGPYEET